MLLKLGRRGRCSRLPQFRRFNGDTAARRADLGEAIAAAAGGVVTAEARQSSSARCKLDAGEVKARYFTAIAAAAGRKPEQAGAIWREMLKSASRNAPWRPLVVQALARLGGEPAPELPERTSNCGATT